ncbi:hypothetical protein MRX96_008600 [Rhipicephalus microplus]
MRWNSCESGSRDTAILRSSHLRFFTSIIVAPGNSMKSVFCIVANVVINILSSGPLKIVGSVTSELENAIGMQC